MEYSLLIIPILAIVFLYVRHPYRIAVWECVLMISVAILTIWASKAIVEKVQVTDQEIWGGFITQANHTTEYNVYVQQTCECCCDKDGKNCSTYDCSYVQYVPPSWECWDNNGEHFELTEQKFNQLVQQFTNGPTVIGHISGYTINATVYATNYDWNFDHLEPTAVEHTYENRVQASTSIYNWPSVDIKKNELYPVPNVMGDYGQKPILGPAGDNEQRLFERLNGAIGKDWQCHVYVMMFYNRPASVGREQEAAWKGGNKNELNICLGLNDDNKIEWVYVFSWTERNDFKNNVRDYIRGWDGLNLAGLADYLYDNIPHSWERKHFRDFKTLTVSPPTWVIFLDAIILIGVCFGIGAYAVNNDFDNEFVKDPERTKRYRSTW